MKRFFVLLVLALSFTVYGQAPVQRNPFTTNTTANVGQFSASGGTVSIKSGVLTTNLSDGGTVSASTLRSGGSLILSGQTGFPYTDDGTNLLRNGIPIAGGTAFGSGTPNTVAKWTGTNTLGDSSITDDQVNNIVEIGDNLTGASVDTVTDLFALGFGSLATAAITNANNVFSYGDVVFDTATVVDSDNIFGFGDAALSQANINNANEVYAFGQNALANSVIVDGSGQIYGIGSDSLGVLLSTNSIQIYGFGDSVLNNTIVTDSSEIYGIGGSALKFITILSSQNIYGFGDSLDGAVVDSSTDIFSYGTSSLSGATVTGALNVYAFGQNAMIAATLNGGSDIYAFGTDALNAANLTNSTGVYAIGTSAGIAMTGSHTNVILMGDASPNSGAHDAVILGTSYALQLSGNTNRYTDNGTTLLRNGSPISATGDTTATNIVTLAQTGTNVTAMDFSLVARGGVFKLSLTNNAFMPTPSNVGNTTFSKCWLAVQQPSTGTCFLTWTNNTFAFPESNPWIIDTNNGAVTYYELVSDVFSNGVVNVWMSTRMGR